MRGYLLLGNDCASKSSNDRHDFLHIDENHIDENDVPSPSYNKNTIHFNDHKKKRNFTSNCRAAFLGSRDLYRRELHRGLLRS